MRILRRPEPVTVPDWREDAKVVATRARLAALDEQLAHVPDQLAAHDLAIAEATKQLDRVELEVLAGKNTDATLATKQAAHLDARRQRARTAIAAEDAQAERDRLAAALPGIEKRAKQVSHDAFRARGLTLVKELRAIVTALVQADAEFAALVVDAGVQFSTGVADRRHPDYDPDFSPRAGLGNFSVCHVNGYRQDVISMSGAISEFVNDLDRALEILENR